MIKMKKRLAWVAVVVAVMLLVTGCSFTTNFFNNTEMATMKAKDKVTEMMTALTAGDTDAARALMHPNRKETAEAGIQQMIELLDSRKVASLDLQGVNVSTRSGTSGEARQEQGTFRMELEDGTVFFLSAVHFTDGTGEGFISFQLVLGVV